MTSRLSLEREQPPHLTNIDMREHQGRGTFELQYGAGVALSGGLTNTDTIPSSRYLLRPQSVRSEHAHPQRHLGHCGQCVAE
jgi:hypothetical protein